MAMSFKVGDFVQYVSKCHDHHANSKLMIGNVYTVAHAESDSCRLEEAGGWWVDNSHITLYTGDLSYLKYKRVCIKIIAMEKRFKEKQDIKLRAKNKREAKIKEEAERILRTLEGDAVATSSDPF
jgi:hypothetical protein